MGKKIILAVLFIMMVGAVNADNHRLYLFRSNKDNEYNPGSRSPTAPLIVLQDGHQIILLQSEQTVQVALIKDNVVVYVSSVIEDTNYIELPTSFYGEYILEMYIGDVRYCGNIKL